MTETTSAVNIVNGDRSIGTFSEFLQNGPPNRFSEMRYFVMQGRIGIQEAPE